MSAALARLRQTAPGATAQLSAGTATPEVVAPRGGALSAAAPGRPGIDIVRDFLSANADSTVSTPSRSPACGCWARASARASGMRMVRVEQRLGGRLVLQSEPRFILDGDGRVWRSLGAIAPKAAAAAATAAPAALQPDALLSVPA